MRGCARKIKTKDGELTTVCGKMNITDASIYLCVDCGGDCYPLEVVESIEIPENDVKGHEHCVKFKQKEQPNAANVPCYAPDMDEKCRYCKYIPVSPEVWREYMTENNASVQRGPAPKNTAAEKKQNLDLVPWHLIAMYLPNAYEEGLIKYFKESWKQGFTTSEMFAGAMRHLIAYRVGEDYDPEAAKLGIKKHHLAGALFCILCMLDTFTNHKEFDDRNKDHRPKGWGPEMMQRQIEEQLKKQLKEEK